MELGKMTSTEVYSAGGLGDTGVPADLVVFRADETPSCSSKMQRIRKYFEEKRGANSFNQRADLQPRELAQFLPFFAIMDVIGFPNAASGPLQDARLRLMGTKVAAMYSDGTGKLISEHFGAEMVHCFQYLAKFAIHEKAPSIARAGVFSGGRSSRQVSILLVPFSEDKLRVDQFLMFLDVCYVDLDGNFLSSRELQFGHPTIGLQS